MLFAVLGGFPFALAAPFLLRTGRAAGWILAAFPATLFIFFARFLPDIAAGERLLFHYDWLPQLGVSLSFSLDGLSLLFALLITGIGAVVCLYSPSYFSGHPGVGKFASALFVFMASMLGVVTADNLVALFLFWELTSVSSYLLIGFDHGREAARRAALQALLVTGLGGLALLAGVLLLQQVAGSFQLSMLLDGRSLYLHPQLYTVTAVCFLGAIATKSAQFPFHFWLPNAMEAPTPVSTYLHAATMVKAGVYLAARMTPVLGGTALWQGSLVALGTATMLAGAFLALSQTDLKRILAQSTVSTLGTLVLLIGLGSPGSIQACMVMLAAHGIYKGALFLGAGIIDHETGTRDVDRLGLLRRTMPITGVAVMLAALSSAGFPPFLGFVSKELLFEATLPASFPGVITAAAVAVSMVLVALALLVGMKPFFGTRADLPRSPHEPPVEMWLGPLGLGGLGLFLGFSPSDLHRWLLEPAVAASLGRPVQLALPSFHLLDVKILLSVAAFLGGGLIFLGGQSLRRLVAIPEILQPLTPGRIYDRLLQGLEMLAALQTRFFQSGRLPLYLLTVIVTVVGLLSWSLIIDDIGISDLKLQRWTDIRTYEAVIAVVIVIATLVVVTSTSRLVAVVALGVVGYGVALTFLVFSAPDLAMTQFAIETLSVILLVLVLFNLPKYRKASASLERARDGLAALAVGSIATLMVLFVTSLDRTPRLVSFFAENSYLLAKGRNVVNVILVDFRGFDTLGEITVLSVAAVGVFALVKLSNRPGSDTSEQE